MTRRYIDMFNHYRDHRAQPLSKSPPSVYSHRELLHFIARVARPVDWATRQHQRHSNNTKFHLTTYHGQKWHPSLSTKQFLLLYNPSLPNQSKRQNWKQYHFRHRLKRTMMMNVKSTPPNQTKPSKSTHLKTTINIQKHDPALTHQSDVPGFPRDAVERLVAVIPILFVREKWPRFCIASVQPIAAPFALCTMIQIRTRRTARRFGFKQRTKMMMLIIYRDYWIRLWMIWMIVILIPNKLFVYKKYQRTRQKVLI